MSSPKPKVYNDGIVYVVEESKESTSFSAKQNGTERSDFKTVIKLMFRQASMREQDLDFADSIGRTLSLKIVTHSVSNIDSTHKMIIDGKLYDILNFDVDRANRETYFYLEEVRKLA